MRAGQTSPGQLVEGYRSEILAYLSRLLRNRADAEDLCQDVLLRACRGVGGLRPHSNLRAWLYKISTNMAFNALRRRNRRWRYESREREIRSAEAYPSPHARVELRQLVQAVDRLPRRQRAALIQRHFQGLAYRDIAITMGCTETAARANVYQALKKLRDALGD